MIIIFINTDDDDDDDHDHDDHDDDHDDDGYGDFSFFHICVYIDVYLIRIPKCVNIPSIHSKYNVYFPVSPSKSRHGIGQNNWARS